MQTRTDSSACPLLRSRADLATAQAPPGVGGDTLGPPGGITCSRSMYPCAKKALTALPRREGWRHDRRARGGRSPDGPLTQPAPAPHAHTPGRGGAGVARRRGGDAAAHGRCARWCGAGFALLVLPLLVG